LSASGAFSITVCDAVTQTPAYAYRLRYFNVRLELLAVEAVNLGAAARRSVPRAFDGCDEAGT
jgi:hypothetical protein